jgi:hypothetical protein
MRAARVLFVVSLLVVGLAAAAMAQSRITMPGTYPAKVAVVPAALPGGIGSLPLELQNVGPDLYVGDVTISRSGGSYTVSFHGQRADGARLNASAEFSPAWTGLLLGNLVVGSSLEFGVIMSIDAAHLLHGQVNGVGTVNGINQRVVAHIGAGGTIDSFKILKAPGPLR